MYLLVQINTDINSVTCDNSEDKDVQNDDENNSNEKSYVNVIKKNKKEEKEKKIMPEKK